MFDTYLSVYLGRQKFVGYWAGMLDRPISGSPARQMFGTTAPANSVRSSTPRAVVATRTPAAAMSAGYGNSDVARNLMRLIPLLREAC
jgi:hypothetical protein